MTAARTFAGSAWAVATALIAATALQLLLMDAAVLPYDEGLVLLGADRVLRGDVPYRDFWSLYGPATFYLPAAAFHAFGESVLVARLVDSVLKTAIVWASFVAVRRLGDRRVAFAAAGAVLALLIGIRAYGQPAFAATAAAMWAVLALDRALRAGRLSDAVAAGAATGVAGLFRHDFGVYAALACATLLAWRFTTGTSRARHALGFGLGAVAVVGPVLLLLLVTVPTADLENDFVRIPLQIYPAVRALPFPSLAGVWSQAAAARSLRLLEPLVVYVPVLLLVACAALQWRAWQRGQPPRRDAMRLLVGLLALMALLYQKGVVRVSPLHTAPALVLAVVVFAATLAQTRGRALRTALIGIGCAGLFVLAVRAVSTRPAPDPGGAEPSASQHVPAYVTMAAGCPERDVPRLRCFRLDADRDAVARWLLAHGSRGQRVYFGAGRHDKLFVGDTTLAFAAETVSPTRWHDLHPGIETTAAVQREMVAELGAAPLRYVVIDREWDNRAEPNASASSSGVTLLDDWLRDRYRPVFSSGPLTVLEPKPKERGP